jgi:hypothetical protein
MSPDWGPEGRLCCQSFQDTLREIGRFVAPKGLIEQNIEQEIRVIRQWAIALSAAQRL